MRRCLQSANRNSFGVLVGGFHKHRGGIASRFRWSKAMEHGMAQRMQKMQKMQRVPKIRRLIK